jgi:hypothetical protein
VSQFSTKYGHSASMMRSSPASPVFACGTMPVPTVLPANSSIAFDAYGLLRMRSRLRLRSHTSDPINSTLASVDGAYHP